MFTIRIVETSLHLLYFALRHRIFPIRSYNDAIDRLSPSTSFTIRREVADGALNKHGSVEVIHPYLGFVADPEQTPDTSYLGFPYLNDDPLVRINADSIVIGIFGGSFAEGTSTIGQSAIELALREQTINSRILTGARGVYKQPQQLLSHGAKFDLVVNFDGFNEVALPQAENLPKGVNLFYDDNCCHPRRAGYEIVGN